VRRLMKKRRIEGSAILSLPGFDADMDDQQVWLPAYVFVPLRLQIVALDFSE